MGLPTGLTSSTRHCFGLAESTVRSSSPIRTRARLDILKIHSRKMNLTRGIDLKNVSDKMNNASGAELKSVCTEAGMFALRERRVHVTQEDFEMAVAKVMKKY